MTRDHVKLISPLAGAAGTAHGDAAEYENRWLIVDGVGRWLADAQRLAPLQVDIRFGYLVLRAEGMLRLDIPLDVIEDDDSVMAKAKVGGQSLDVVDEGEVAAIWVSKVVGQPARLVKLHPEDQPVDWAAA